MAMEMDVCIVGGGLAGLALAIGMQERGIRAHVFEKAPKIRPHSGTALSLAANGTNPANIVASDGNLVYGGQFIQMAVFRLPK